MSTETNPGLMDAINEALGEEPAAVTEVEEEIASAEDAVEEGEEAAPLEGEEESAEGKEGAEGRNVDGTFKKKDAATDPAIEAKKPDDKKVPEVKAADPLNDPIPKDLKPATQERIRSLVKTAKDVTQERDAVRKDFDYMVNGLQAVGASPEQYGETLSWLALFNSNDPAQQEKALELVEGVAERLSTLLGKERTVGDPLGAHEDLRSAVAAGKVTPQYAREIARTRNQNGFKTELTTAARTQGQQQQQQTDTMNRARSDLNNIEASLKISDPQYEAKKAQIVPMLKPIFERLSPSEWPTAFQEAYKHARVAPSKAAIPVNQPLRAGKNPAGGRSSSPGSALDAVNDALAGMKH